jgi:hypothetical protein
VGFGSRFALKPKKKLFHLSGGSNGDLSADCFSGENPTARKDGDLCDGDMAAAGLNGLENCPESFFRTEASSDSFVFSSNISDTLDTWGQC